MHNPIRQKYWLTIDPQVLVKLDEHTQNTMQNVAGTSRVKLDIPSDDFKFIEWLSESLSMLLHFYH